MMFYQILKNEKTMIWEEEKMSLLHMDLLIKTLKVVFLKCQILILVLFLLSQDAKVGFKVVFRVWVKIHIYLSKYLVN